MDDFNLLRIAYLHTKNKTDLLSRLLATEKSIMVTFWPTLPKLQSKHLLIIGLPLFFIHLSGKLRQIAENKEKTDKQNKPNEPFPRKS